MVKKSTRQNDAISDAKSKKASRFGNLGCALFSLPFFFAGVAVIYFLGLSPVLKIMRASSWDATPCVITSSRVVSSSDGDTFSVEIHYAYNIGGKQYNGTRYSFVVGSSSGYSSKEKVVKENPVGKNATCYVNPLDPQDAVFNRGFTWDMLWGLFGVPFLLVGAGGLVMSTRSFIKERRSRLPRQQDQAGGWPSFNAIQSSATLSTTQGGAPLQSVSPRPATVASSAVSQGRVVLEPAMTPARRLMLITFVALFWNGIVSVFVVVLIKEWGRGNIEWIMALFLTPFVLIGLALLFGVAHGFLSLFNPRPRLTIGSRELKLGSSSDLDWEFSGATGRIKQLRIYLEGREEATYRRGTDTLTDKNVFATIEIASKPNADPGRASVQIPLDTMHSFKSDNNKIVWEIHVKGEIGFWSDVNESFEIDVLPRRDSGSS